MVVGVCTGLSVCLIVPSILVAGSDVESGVVVIDDCKIECIGTGTVLFVEIVKGVVTRGGISVVVPSVEVAGIKELALVCTVIDGKV